MLFSYAEPTDPVPRRLAIRTIERFTGQPRLKRLYLQHQRWPRPGESFWQSALRLLEIQVDYERAQLEQLPRRGPVVVVANHPYGVVDGLAIGHLVSLIRTDFKILTNGVLLRAPEIRPYVLPIEFAETRAARATNLASRAAARTWLERGGAVVVFPGGTVSTAGRPFAKTALDPAWKPFTATLIQRSSAPVLPIYFEGQNSRLFQLASHVSHTLRLSLLFNEVNNKIGGRIGVRIGKLLRHQDLAQLSDRQQLVDHLRTITYALGAAPAAVQDLSRPAAAPD